MVIPGIDHAELDMSPNIGRAEPGGLVGESSMWVDEPTKPARVLEEECDIACVLQFSTIWVHLQSPPVKIVIARSFALGKLLRPCLPAIDHYHKLVAVHSLARLVGCCDPTELFNCPGIVVHWGINW